MAGATGDDRPTIVVLELEVELAGYLRDWSAVDPEVRTPDSPSDVGNALDGSVDLVMIGLDLARPVTAAWVRATPYLGPLAMVIDEPSFDLEELPVDLYIEPPVTRDRIHRATEQVLKRVRSYDNERELLALLSEQLAIEQDVTTPAELEDSPNYQLLVEEIEDYIDKYDLEVTTISSKYRPPTCPNCDLRWDREVGSTVGFVKISSFSWKCVACGDVSPGINPFDRSVARR